MNAALAQLGFPMHPVDAYRYFVGDGIECEARRALPKDHLDNDTVSRCLALANEEYNKCWADNTRPYRGIEQLLSVLNKRDIPLAILSNKPNGFTQIMVERLLSRWSFRIVRGARPSVPEKPDPTVALEIAAELKIPASKFLYLGDTNTDMQTANSAGMYAVGALWGFRTTEELLANGAQALAEIPADVLNILYGNQQKD